MPGQYSSIIESPVGRLQVIADKENILEVRFEESILTEIIH
ncbi:MAG: hypothetical protein WCM76_10790 [Bacteroidota bacterium]